MKNQLENSQAAIQYFPPKATSAGEIANLVKNVRITMERQNSPAVKVAKKDGIAFKAFWNTRNRQLCGNINV
ncbi:MAG: hypothetical protein MRZ61_02760 [Oscillospiraceae bacterium]|nr:hypothetical protein [Oscillospiraceae bacterium]